MALSDRDPRNVKKGPPCSACLMESRMSADDLATLNEWWDDPGITTNAILLMLDAEDYGPPSEFVLARHRARKCWGRRVAG